MSKTTSPRDSRTNSDQLISYLPTDVKRPKSEGTLCPAKKLPIYFPNRNKKKKHKTLRTSLQLLEFVNHQGLEKPFKLYLYLKLHCGDKVNGADKIIAKAQEDLGMNDSKGRTFKKHMKKCLDLDWIGYNAEKDIYHVRSLRHLQVQYRFNQRSAVKITPDQIIHLKKFIPAVIIGKRISSRKYVCERKPLFNGKDSTGLRAATENKKVANQPKTPTTKPAYYGVSLAAIAEQFKCSKSQASKLKTAADKMGYLQVIHRYETVCVLDRPDHSLRSSLHPDEAKRTQFWKIELEGRTEIHVVRQLIDEIKPRIKFCRTGRVKLPPKDGRGKKQNPARKPAVAFICESTTASKPARKAYSKGMSYEEFTTMRQGAGW